MLIKKEFKYEPQTLNDIIFGNPESKLRIYDIVTGSEPLPSSGKSGILLYGVYGTGKTTLAKMLPNAIEQGKSQTNIGMNAEFIACQQGFNGANAALHIVAMFASTDKNLAKRLHDYRAKQTQAAQAMQLP
jgi:Cdc6-like AAA superfamily ATPase